MKKTPTKQKLRRLRLERETLRDLTPEHLDHVAGGTNTSLNDDTRHNSCDLAQSKPLSYCTSCQPLICG